MWLGLSLREFMPTSRTQCKKYKPRGRTMASVRGTRLTFLTDLCLLRLSPEEPQLERQCHSVLGSLWRSQDQGPLWSVSENLVSLYLPCMVALSSQ